MMLSLLQDVKYFTGKINRSNALNLFENANSIQESRAIAWCVLTSPVLQEPFKRSLVPVFLDSEDKFIRCMALTLAVVSKDVVRIENQQNRSLDEFCYWLRAAARSGQSEVIDLVSELYEECDHQFRAILCSTVGELRNSRAAAWLATTFEQESNGQVKLFAAVGMLKCGEQSQLDFLESSLLSIKDRSIRILVAGTLEACGSSIGATHAASIRSNNDFFEVSLLNVAIHAALRSDSEGSQIDSR